MKSEYSQVPRMRTWMYSGGLLFIPSTTVAQVNSRMWLVLQVTCVNAVPQTSLSFPQDTLNQSHGIGHLLYGLRMVWLSMCALTTGKDTIFPDQNKDKKKFYFLIPLHHLII